MSKYSEGTAIWFVPEGAEDPVLGRIVDVDEQNLPAQVYRTEYGEYKYGPRTTLTYEVQRPGYEDAYFLQEKQLIQEAAAGPFDALIGDGQTHVFYGVDGLHFKLDDTVFEAVEDPKDGLRSLLDTVVVYPQGLIFFLEPLAPVTVVELNNDNSQALYDSFYGYGLIDPTDGHLWLVVGTATSQDYYPMFRFEYYPLKKEAK
jgi:hypothetical protein